MYWKQLFKFKTKNSIKTNHCNIHQPPFKSITVQILKPEYRVTLFKQTNLKIASQIKHLISPPSLNVTQWENIYMNHTQRAKKRPDHAIKSPPPKENVFLPIVTSMETSPKPQYISPLFLYISILILILSFPSDGSNRNGHHQV